MNTNVIIKNLITFINEELAQTGGFEAISAYDKFGIHQPLEKPYFTLKAQQDHVSFTKDEAGRTGKKTSLTVLLTALAPLREKALDVYTMCETVMEYLGQQFYPAVSGYRIGQLKVDTDLKAFKIPCRLYFEGETSEETIMLK